MKTKTQNNDLGGLTPLNMGLFSWILGVSMFFIPFFVGKLFVVLDGSCVGLFPIKLFIFIIILQQYLFFILVLFAVLVVRKRRERVFNRWRASFFLFPLLLGMIFHIVLVVIFFQIVLPTLEMQLTGQKSEQLYELSDGCSLTENQEVKYDIYTLVAGLKVLNASRHSVVVHPTNEEIKEAERALHFIFPKSFKFFLREGFPDSVSTGKIYWLGKSSSGLSNIVLENQKKHTALKSSLPEYLICFYEDKNGDLSCFDMRHKKKNGEYFIMNWNPLLSKKENLKRTTDYMKDFPTWLFCKLDPSVRGLALICVK